MGFLSTTNKKLLHEASLLGYWLVSPGIILKTVACRVIIVVGEMFCRCCCMFIVSGLFLLQMRLLCSSSSCSLLTHGLPTLSIVQQHPVVNAVFCFSRCLECLGKQFTQEVVVGGFLKAQFADILQVNPKFFYKS